MDRMPGLLRRRVGLNSSSDSRPQMDSPLRAVTCVDSEKLCGNRMTQAATAAVGQQCEKGGVMIGVITVSRGGVGRNSSSNSPPQMDSPPVPSPVFGQSNCGYVDEVCEVCRDLQAVDGQRWRTTQVNVVVPE
jgi:hypothetical protein